MHQYLLQHLLEESAKRYPDREAVIFKDKSVNYTELNLKSDQLAQALKALGVSVGDRVAFMQNKSIESVICLFGILKAGAIYVPIDPLAPSSRAKYIIDNCEIKLLITSNQCASTVIRSLNDDSFLTKVVMTDGDLHKLTELYKKLKFFSWESLLAESKNSVERVDISDTSPAYILHTSGSTGTPKGVVISHHNSMSFVDMAADFFEIRNIDRFCSHAPLHFDLSVFDIFVAVKCGASIVLVPEYFSLFPSKLIEYITQKKVTIWNSVASVIVLLANYENLQKYNFDLLRTVIFSGEVLPIKYLRRIKKYVSKAQFYNLYGQTEANSSMCYLVEDIPADDGWKIPIGKPFQNFEIFLLNNDNNVITKSGEEGELYVKSSTIAIGYWRDKDKTGEVFVTDPRDFFQRPKVYKTGDIAKMDADGNYILIGRKDRVVKSRGYRIELDEVEGTLNNHPLVNQAAVINFPDELIGNKIIAFVSPIDGEKLEISDLSDYCSKFLPKYMIPEPINIFDSLPTTPTGKIDRKYLAVEAI